MAAYERLTDVMGFSASLTLATKQFYAVYISSAGYVKIHDGSCSQKVFGILENEPAAGETAEVAYVAGDVTKWICDGATTCNIAIMDPLWANDSGRGFKCITNGSPHCAYALAAATGASGAIPVLWTGVNCNATASGY